MKPLMLMESYALPSRYPMAALASFFRARLGLMAGNDADASVGPDAGAPHGGEVVHALLAQLAAQFVFGE